MSCTPLPKAVKSICTEQLTRLPFKFQIAKATTGKIGIDVFQRPSCRRCKMQNYALAETKCVVVARSSCHVWLFGSQGNRRS